MRTCHAILHIWWRSVQSFIDISPLLSLPCGLLSSGFGADGEGSWKIRCEVRLRWLRLCSAQVFLSWPEPYVILKYGHQRSSHSLKLSLVWSINGFWKLNAVNSGLKDGYVDKADTTIQSVELIEALISIFLRLADFSLNPETRFCF